MQYICLSICTLLNSDVKPSTEINDSILETAYRFTTMNFEYNDVVHVMTKGPNPRGRLRKPDKQALKTSLNKLQEQLTAKEATYHVLEWKDTMVYIVDPLFLFYLRWGHNQ